MKLASDRFKCGVQVVIVANAGSKVPGSGRRQLAARAAMGLIMGDRSAHWHTFARLSGAASYVIIESASSWSAGRACIQGSCSARAHLCARIRASKLPVGTIDGGKHDDMETHMA
jgi:hypothetical protein